MKKYISTIIAAMAVSFFQRAAFANADPTTKGAPTTVVFGINAVVSWATGSTGRIVRAEVDPTNKIEPLPDGNGVPTGAIFIPQELKGSIEVEMQTDVTPPAFGDQVTVGTFTLFMAKDAKHSWTRGGIASWTFELYGFPA
jgi:hypothetical protein